MKSTAMDALKIAAGLGRQCRMIRPKPSRAPVTSALQAGHVPHPQVFRKLVPSFGLSRLNVRPGRCHDGRELAHRRLEAERARLEAELAALPEVELVAIHPGLAQVYARKVSGLIEALNAEGTMAEAAEILRGLIERIVLHPDPDAANGHVIELIGELGAILSLCGGGLGETEAKMHKARRASAGVMQFTVVAGAGTGLNRTEMRL